LMSDTNFGINHSINKNHPIGFYCERTQNESIRYVEEENHNSN
jgi:hypothetical protein